ncbi:hypothetical protein EVAR_17274_1 [Eumeta japonica]|uniref:Uncharacterized protein n=1 Tax=Eumeta variegata TaxID=151549 RepID=A0A4C1TT34_EUMVA|nr:hypothetical protein EVAR_17274_1 [Eumeta japonica]
MYTKYLAACACKAVRQYGGGGGPLMGKLQSITIIHERLNECGGDPHSRLSRRAPAHRYLSPPPRRDRIRPHDHRYRHRASPSRIAGDDMTMANRRTSRFANSKEH